MHKKGNNIRKYLELAHFLVKLSTIRIYGSGGGGEKSFNRKDQTKIKLYNSKAQLTQTFKDKNIQTMVLRAV